MSIEHMIMGHIGFVSIASPTSFDLEKKIDFAEHQVTEGKPLLQYMGPALDGIGLSFMFHADYTDPQTAWDKILDLFNQHSAFPLSMGNGQLIGQYVITGLTRTTTVTSEDGTLVAIECKVTLKEYADPEPLKTKQVAKKSKAKAVKKAGKRKPNSKKAEIPKLDAASRAAGYKLVNGKSVVRQ